ncbi:MAG: hypothetical protein ACMVP2_08260 [Imperialibacter sp.]|uniref:hypothetical protein n=1 Tax=Imperialibacter sp. TaxID=2038411 RepID=UPI0030DA6780|tara:strand:+ start:95 stop:499 length:405 start_codon:yes stop_codon:yes gene_type:complete
MSWDLFVQDWGTAKTLEEIPDDFQPQPIGLRSSIIRQIQTFEPAANFDDPSWGTIENDQFSIEFNMGKEEELGSFVLHVRGDELAIPCIGNILKHLGLRAADGSNGEFFDNETATEKMQAWMEFRDRVTGKKSI